MNNWQVQSFRALDSHRTAIKALELARQKTFFALKIQIYDFCKQNTIHSTLTLYIATMGVDVKIIGVTQQQKLKFWL